MLTFKEMLRAVRFEADYANYSAPPRAAKPTEPVVPEASVRRLIAEHESAAPSVAITGDKT